MARMTSVVWRRFCILLSLTFLQVTPALADTYPSRPIKLVVPFGAGASDAIARIVAEGMREQMGVPIVVENRPGANGNLGTQFVARAPADGYTVLFVSSSLVTSPALYVNPGYDPIRDYLPLVAIGSIPLLAVVPTSVPVRSIKEFVDYAVKHPDKISYGSAGIGNVTHLVAQAFFDAIGAKAVHVPYRGIAPIPDLVSGRLQFYTGSPSSLVAVAKEGRVVPLALTTTARLTLLPEIPTLNETVLPGFDKGIWYGIVAAAGTPPSIANVLVDSINKVLSKPDVKARLDQQGVSPMRVDQKGFAGFIREELDLWSTIIRSAGVKPE